MGGFTKYDLLAERDEEKFFSFLRIRRVSYPNENSRFELRPVASEDERAIIAINASPRALLAELRRVATWLEAESRL